MYVCKHRLQEEEENEGLLLALLERSKRNDMKSIYQNRYRDGYCRILIKNHLVDSRATYRQFFRLYKELFFFFYVGKSSYTPVPPGVGDRGSVGFLPTKTPWRD